MQPTPPEAMTGTVLASAMLRNAARLARPGAIRSDVGADDGSNPGAAQFTGQSSGFNIAFFDPSPCCYLAVPGIDPNDDSA